MKNALYIINGILLIAVSVLFYLFFTEKKNGTSVIKSSTWVDTSKTSVRIAYFDEDSVSNSIEMVKEIKEELSKEEEKNKIEYSKLQKLYAERYNKYQGKPMSQVESEAARADLMQLQQTIKSKQDELDEKFRELYVRRQQEVKTKIENFLKEYNKSKGFTYILKNVPEIMYYKDSVYDITSDVIKGLNERFPVKKK